MSVIFEKRSGRRRVFCERHTEGYTVSMEVVEELAKKGSGQELLKWIDKVRDGLDELEEKVRLIEDSADDDGDLDDEDNFDDEDEEFEDDEA